MYLIVLIDIFSVRYRKNNHPRPSKVHDFQNCYFDIANIAKYIYTESANEINFIVSFLKVSGVRILLDDLLKFCQKEGNRLRIITTTYCGATQAKAIEQLAALPNTEIRISYNTDIERLHAKSYIFVRNSGMNTAYIGSSNLSKSMSSLANALEVLIPDSEDSILVLISAIFFLTFMDVLPILRL